MHLLSLDECRTLLFEFSVEGSALSVDHVISVHVTESPGDCELKCYLEDDCMSINTGPMGDGTYYCELSDSDHVLHPRDLENRIGVIYRSVKVRISRINWRIEFSFNLIPYGDAFRLFLELFRFPRPVRIKLKTIKMKKQSSLDSLQYFVMNNRANLLARHRHCISERHRYYLSLNKQWPVSTSWLSDTVSDMTGETPPVRNGDYFSLLSVNCMRYEKSEKSPYITVNRSRFSSKGHMTLLISEFQSTETWSKSSLWVLKEKYNSWLRVQALNTIYINIYIYRLTNYDSVTIAC